MFIKKIFLCILGMAFVQNMRADCKFIFTNISGHPVTVIGLYDSKFGGQTGPSTIPADDQQHTLFANGKYGCNGTKAWGEGVTFANVANQYNNERVWYSAGGNAVRSSFYKGDYFKADDGSPVHSQGGQLSDNEFFAKIIK